MSYNPPVSTECAVSTSSCVCVLCVQVLHELELSYAENRHFHVEYALLVEQLRDSESSAKELRERLRTAEEEGQQANR